MKILIADDIEDTRSLLTLLLQKRGHTVFEAAGGRDAVSRALEERPDLILMDISMPDMDGLAAARAIRENAQTAHIPIAAISAFVDDPAWRNRALAAGCNRCFAKPLDFEALEGIMEAGSSEPRAPDSPAPPGRA
jgi:CheY-like chemotaxis protein